MALVREFVRLNRVDRSGLERNQSALVRSEHRTRGLDRRVLPDVLPIRDTGVHLHERLVVGPVPIREHRSGVGHLWGMSVHTETVSTERRTLMTIDELGAYLVIGRTSIYRLIAAGDLSPVRVGHRLRFRPDDVEAYLVRNRGTP
jgi:excisionase family DNA binding protein